MSYFYDLQKQAAEKLKALLDRPMPQGQVTGDIEEFDPWVLFPIYGSYSQDFDQCAIDVLEEIISENKVRRDLGAEMFREMLCNLNLCEYGSSPRVCFPATSETRDLFPRWVEMWKEYSALQWGE